MPEGESAASRFPVRSLSRPVFPAWTQVQSSARIIASACEMSISCPSPVRRRAESAARTAMADNSAPV
jgi:hypothetical protein